MSVRLLMKLEFGYRNSEQQRMIFRTELRKRGWLPFRGQSNLVCTEIRDTPPDQEILAAAEQELRSAARVARITHWSCVCILEDADTWSEELNRAV